MKFFWDVSYCSESLKRKIEKVGFMLGICLLPCRQVFVHKPWLIPVNWCFFSDEKYLNVKKKEYKAILHSSRES